MSSDTFRTIHRLYRRLKRIKTLVEMPINSVALKLDIFGVFSSRISEMLSKVKAECTKPDITTADKVRLMAIQLALHIDHIESMIKTLASSSTNRLTVEIQRIENGLQSFAEFHSHELMFLMYFKVLNLLAKINYDPLRNFTMSKHWLNEAERMYMDLMSTNTESNFYDNRELFGKSVILKPSPDGFDTVDTLFGENMRLFEEIIQNESNEIDQLVQAFYQDNSNWLKQFLATLPRLRTENDLQSVAYLLLIARKLATRETDSKVHSSIVTGWMHYFFSVFGRSKEKLLQQFSDSDGEMVTFRKSFTTEHGSSYKIHDILDASISTAASKSTFNCFSSALPLAQDELKLCVNFIDDIQLARNLLNYSIDMAKKLIRDHQISHDPMNFIVPNYQLLDLLSISTILTDDLDQCFHFQVQRFDVAKRMIDWMRESCPKVYRALDAAILSDLNEILIDLYAVNVQRALRLMNKTDERKRNIRNEFEEKLSELQEMNLYLTESIGNKVK